MPRIANPYGIQTPIGAGLSSLSRLALARRDNADRQALIDAQAEQAAAHSALYGAQTDKVMAERRAIEEQAAARAPDAQDEAVALRYGVPVANVRGYRGYVGGQNAMPPALPGGVNHADVGRTLYSLRTGLMDKTSSAADIALGENRLREGDARGGVVAGTVNPTAFRQAYGTGPVFSQNAQGSVLNTVEGGVDQSNPLAVANINSERAQANQRNAAAGASGALQRQRDFETRTGVNIGAPVLVNDPEVGPIYVAPSAAAGRAPAARPTDRSDPLVPVLRDGKTVYVPRSEAAGEEVGARPTAPRVGGTSRTPQVRGLTGPQQKSLGESLDAMHLGLDPAHRTQIVAAATALATNPASEQYMNPTGALEAVLQGVEIENPMFGKRRIANPAAFAPAVPRAAPTAARAPVQITSDADYARLPSGTTYIAPDGTTRRKP